MLGWVGAWMQDSQLDEDGQLPGERSAVGSEADTYQREVCKHTIEAYFFCIDSSHVDNIFPYITKK